MTDSISYKVEVGVDETVDQDELDNLLQDILLDLYDDGSVQSIHVTKDGYTVTNDDVEELISVMDAVQSRDIKNAIDMVKRLESMEGDDG